MIKNITVLKQSDNVERFCFRNRVMHPPVFYVRNNRR